MTPQSNTARCAMVRSGWLTIGALYVGLLAMLVVDDADATAGQAIRVTTTAPSHRNAAAPMPAKRILAPSPVSPTAEPIPMPEPVRTPSIQASLQTPSPQTPWSTTPTPTGLADDPVPAGNVPRWLGPGAPADDRAAARDDVPVGAGPPIADLLVSEPRSTAQATPSDAGTASRRLTFDRRLTLASLAALMLAGAGLAIVGNRRRQW